MAQENVEIVRLALETWERGDLTGWLKIEKFHKQGKKTPPWLKTDKPWDDPDVTGKPVSVTVQIPPLDSLVHVRRPLPGHQGGAAPWEAARRAAVLLLQPLKRGAPSREAFGEARWRRFGTTGWARGIQNGPPRRASRVAFRAHPR
jgi:hypothetical protein